MRSGRYVSPQPTPALARPATVLLVALAAACLAATTPVGAQHPPVVRGEVVDAASGLPVPGATIEPDRGGGETATGSDGRFELRGLLPGTRELRVSALGYLERSTTVEAENGRVSAVRVELRRRPLPVEGFRVHGGAAASAAPGIRTLDRTEIRASDAADLGELLDGVAGVTVTRRGGAGAPATVSIRGGSPDEVLVLVDGMPVNSLLTGEADLSTIPLAGVERVVVLPGGQSVRYGPRALAGAILVETRDASRLGGEVRGGTGSRGERLGEGSIAGELRVAPETALRGRLSGEWRTGDGDVRYTVPDVRGGGHARRENADHEVRSAWGSATLERPSLRLRLRGHALETARGMPGPVVQPTPAARQGQRRLTTTLSAEGLAGAVGWETRIDLQRQTARYEDPDPPAAGPYDDRVAVDAAGFTASADAALGDVRLDGGAELRRYGISNTMLAGSAPDGHATLGLWAAARWDHDLGRRTSVSLSPGVRLDRSSLLDGSVVSPKATLTLGRGLLVGQLSVGNAFSPPSLADQFFHEGVLARPNPDLRPERLRGEVDAALELAGARLGPAEIDLRLSAFRADVDGMILWLPDHRFVWQPHNFDVDRRGWEVRADAALRDDRLRARLAVSRSRAEYAGSTLEGQVAYRPATTAGAALSGRIGPLAPELELSWSGGRRTVPGSSANALDPYWTADVSVRAGFELAGWTLEPRAAVENLFDRPAAMLVDYPSPGRGWSLRLRVTRSRTPGAP